LKKAASQRPSGFIIAPLTAAVDDVYMGLYASARRNARRITRLVIAFLPLMMLLVGSCKTNQTSAAGDLLAGMDALRAALFPDRVIARDADYHPAPGFVGRAQDFVEGDPASLNRLTEQEVGFLFGAPVMQRRDADARIWQYQSRSCVVDFYFYDQPGHKNESRVAYVDYRLREDLVPGSEPRSEPLPLRSQSRCLRKIAS
jgi:hypothetical protein